MQFLSVTDSRAMSLQVSYNYLKSLRSFMGENYNLKAVLSSRSACGAVRGSYDLLAMCLHATGMHFFFIFFHSVEFN